MTGEPREDMEQSRTDRIPPVVTSHRLAAATDAALAGAALPPYRRGLYAALAANETVSALTAALEASSDVGPPVAEGWPAAWRDDPMPAHETESLREEASPEPAVWDDAPTEAAEWHAAAADTGDREEAPSPEPAEWDPAVPATAGWEEAPSEEPADWAAEPEPFSWGEAAEPEQGRWEESASPEVSDEDGAAPDPAWADEVAAETADWHGEGRPDEVAEDAEFLHLEEADLAAVEAERDPTGYDQAAADLMPPEEPPVHAVDEADVWAWEADETAVYDMPGAAAEDTGPWQDTWDATAEAVAPDVETAERFQTAAEPEPLDGDGPEPAGDVQEWLEAGAVGSYGWDLPEEQSPGPAFDESAPTSAAEAETEPWAAAAGLDALAEPVLQREPDGWADAEAGTETGEVIEMVEEPGSGTSVQFAPVEVPADKPADDEPADDEPADERVAIVPPTPLDSWVHGGQYGPEADATWEAFGRALEEAASWGDLDTTIATGLTPEEARGEVERAPAADPSAQPVAEAQPDAAPADPAVTDLARRLEHLAQRLRTEGEKGVEHAMAEGDRLEASLAGFIAGYVAARRG